MQADVTSDEACNHAVAATVRDLGRIDILINMASLYVSKPFAALTAADWDRQLAVDLRAAFLFSHAAAPVMKKHGGGRIINFADWVAASARPRYPGYVPYYVAKAGVKALTEALALELGGRSDPGQRDRAGTDPRAAGHVGGRKRRGREEHAARTLGRRRGDREGGDVPRQSISSPVKPFASTAGGTSSNGCNHVGSLAARVVCRAREEAEGRHDGRVGEDSTPAACSRT